MMVNEEAPCRGRQVPVDRRGCVKADASPDLECLDLKRLDLKRLVWDPEYRKATRHLWQQAE